eukprot:GAHX01001722.1.p1 GENE.GAHX01001722.1~~GAHX01001722.1.p1  ORF type:complete len:55 (+),score=8.05 GAHX01001722.1:209-373(+)
MTDKDYKMTKLVLKQSQRSYNYYAWDISLCSLISFKDSIYIQIDLLNTPRQNKQ